MTYRDLFDESLDACYQESIDEIPFLRGARAGKLMRDYDELMYNEEFNDWSSGLEGVRCDGHQSSLMDHHH